MILVTHREGLHEHPGGQSCHGSREVFNSGLLYKGRGHSCSMQQRVMIVIVRMGEGGKDEKGGKPERLCGVVEFHGILTSMLP